jgi:hypothetical protein
MAKRFIQVTKGDKTIYRKEKNTLSIDEFKAMQKGSKRKRSNYREADIQKELCKYVRLKYPNSLFNCDCSGLNLSRTQAGQAKAMRSGKGFPDFVLYESIFNRNCYPGKSVLYHALFIEIKKEGESIYTIRKVDAKTGKPTYASPHIAEQMAMIEKLKIKGYYACFGIGLAECMNIVDNYMNGEI